MRERVMQNAGQHGESEFTPQNWATIVWALFLAGFIFPVLAPLAAIIIAHIQRNRFLGTAFYSHMTHALITFWISTIITLFFATGIYTILAQLDWSAPDPFIDSAIPMKNFLIGTGVVFGLLTLWTTIRSIKGLVLALDGAPYRPMAVIF
jgi:uncharacterized membrane protein